MKRLRIQHTCDYRYEYTRQYSAQLLRLTPRRDSFQRTLTWTLQTPGRRAEQVDAHGNITHLVTVEEPHRELGVVVSGLVEITASDHPLPHEGSLSPLVYLAPTALTRPDAALTHLAEQSRPAQGATWDWVARLGRAVRELLPAGLAAPELAHRYLACSRAAGIPARFVSGYRFLDEDRADRSAWVDVWSSGQDGWISLDVERLEPARSRHCRLAVGRDFPDAAPLRSHLTGDAVETLRIRDQ